MVLTPSDGRLPLKLSQPGTYRNEKGKSTFEARFSPLARLPKGRPKQPLLEREKRWAGVVRQVSAATPTSDHQTGQTQCEDGREGRRLGDRIHELGGFQGHV